MPVVTVTCSSCFPEASHQVCLCWQHLSPFYSACQASPQCLGCKAAELCSVPGVVPVDNEKLQHDSTGVGRCTALLVVHVRGSATPSSHFKFLARTAGLAGREQNRELFRFLKPTSSEFHFFTTLCDSYSRVLMPPKGTRERLDQDATDRSVLWLALQYSNCDLAFCRLKRNMTCSVQILSGIHLVASFLQSPSKELHGWC